MRGVAGNFDWKPGLEDWRLGAGHVLDVLRSDVPGLFATGFSRPGHQPDVSIFHEDVRFVDARAPNFELKGRSTYRQFLAALRWSVQAACDESRLEITALSPPVNNEIFMRWRLQLWPKDMMSLAQDLMSVEPRAALGHGEPTIIEGYSRYELDPWSAEVMKHTVDITNPPMYIADLVRRLGFDAEWGVAPQGAWVQTPRLSAIPSPKLQPSPAFVGMTIPKRNRPAIRRQEVEKAKTASSSFAFDWSLPQSCEDDFECNGGRANFPLKCCEIPVIGNYCCSPPDDEPLQRRDPIYVPIPVPIDPWQQRR